MTSPSPLFPETNRVRPEDRAFHDWYRFVLSFPPHLVRHCLERLKVGCGETVVDPFCGTGTTPTEARKLGIAAIGIEANPMAHFASKTKLDWDVKPLRLLANSRHIAGAAQRELDRAGLGDGCELPLFGGGRNRAAARLRALPSESQHLLLANSISPLPLHRVLVLLEAIDRYGEPRVAANLRLALAKVLVSDASNLTFGPEVGVGKPKRDAPVVAKWLRAVEAMAADLECALESRPPSASVVRGDARVSSRLLAAESVDAVITSPPYPNEKDYTRTTRLESVILGLLRNREDLRLLKRSLVRSNTRGVYKTDGDDELVIAHPEIQRLAAAIEARRTALNKTSGFERLYARVTQLYFGGMVRHLADLRAALRPGCRLAYVVGDQASYLRVMIRTGTILANLADSLGYEVLGIELFRTRLATATREQLREEIVLLRWPAPKAKNHRHAQQDNLLKNS